MFLKNRQPGDVLTSYDVSALPFKHILRRDELAAELCREHITKLQEHLGHCLALLGQALGLSGVVLLVSDSSACNYYPYATSCNRPLEPGPYASCSGILGCLKLQAQIAVTPYRRNSPVVPYYKNQSLLYGGGFLAVRIPPNGAGAAMILCLDRMSSDVWQHSELAIVNQSVANIQNFFSVYFDNVRLHIEGDVLQRAFNGLRKLNMALSLEDVYRAISQTIKNSTHVDFCAIASVHEKVICLESWSGECISYALPLQIPLADSVFDQVVKYRHSFPENGCFSSSLIDPRSAGFFKQFTSFLVVPCLQPETPVRFVLIIASLERRELTQRYKNLFDLISDQLAIKLDLALSHDQIRSMALQDALTGISNLRAFNTAFHTMYERAQRNAGHLSLVACDIDHFKGVNDRYGHPCGDQVLKHVASALRNEIRTIDMVARTGGEEFRILLEGADQRVATEIAERIRTKIEYLPIIWQGLQLKVSISMGIATFANDGQDKSLLVNRADQALYRAKNNGRNRVCLWQA